MFVVRGTPARRVLLPAALLLSAWASLARAEELPAAAPDPLVLPAARATFRQETDWFEINAETSESGAVVTAWARELEAAARASVALPEGFPVRIIVRPLADGTRAGAPEASPGGVVLVRADYRGGEATVLGALLQGVLVRALGTAADTVPEWVRLGIVEEARVRATPGLGVQHARAVLDAGAPSLGEWLRPGRRVSPSGAWLAVRVLARVQDGPARLWKFAQLPTNARDGRVAFLEAFGAAPELAAGAQAFWLVEMVGFARESAGTLYVRNWAEFIRRLAVVEIEMPDGATALLGTDALWERRQEAWLRRAAQVRVRECRLALVDTPALWFNPLLSTGQAWEAWLRGDEAAFRAAWSRIAEDLRDAERYDAEITARIEAWDQRLER